MDCVVKRANSEMTRSESRSSARPRPTRAPATSAKNLRTVPQVVEECPAFSEAALRKLILRAPLNGLEPAILRVGRRVLIDYERFNRWLEDQRGQRV